jgi:hypothetical protein
MPCSVIAQSLQACSTRVPKSVSVIGWPRSARVSSEPTSSASNRAIWPCKTWLAQPDSRRRSRHRRVGDSGGEPCEPLGAADLGKHRPEEHMRIVGSFGGIDVRGVARSPAFAQRDAMPLRPARHVHRAHALFGAQVGQGTAMHDVFGVQPNA